ncbi:MAG: S-adenosylmethionine:tRNA ribosyltransferase-isomerase, partial [Candidatus Sericytochromatia bacterium]|nr:S-adenosylmethionine:tRNA ribosyltransferase-isomerase [Candidatus Sericytochromatia bacterium]
PLSTLLMLVSALWDRNKLLNAYELAKENGYKFYSLGDSMFIF